MLAKAGISVKKFITGVQLTNIGSISTTPDLFNTLPIELKLHLFSFLSSSDLCNVATVAEDWKRFEKEMSYGVLTIFQDC